MTSATVRANGKYIQLIPTASGNLDVLIDGVGAGTASVNLAAGTVTFTPTAVERLTRAGVMDLADVAADAGDSLWAEAQAEVAFLKAKQVAATNKAQAWADLDAAARVAGDLATNGPSETKRRAQRLRDVLIRLKGTL